MSDFLQGEPHLFPADCGIIAPFGDFWSRTGLFCGIDVRECLCGRDAPETNGSQGVRNTYGK